MPLSTSRALVLIVSSHTPEAVADWRLTPRGQELIRHYRAIERKALSATAAHLKALQAISRNPRRA